LAGIYILNLGNETARRLTGSWEDAGYADWSPDGSQVVYNVGSESGRHLFLRNAFGENRRQLTSEPGTEDSYPDWSPEGDQIVFARYDQLPVEADVDAEIMLLDLTGEGTIRPLNVRGTSPTFSPDGRQIAFVSDLNGAQDIYVMDVDGDNIVQVTDDPQLNLWPAWSPDGSRLLFVSERDGNLDIYTINVDGSGQERLTDHPAPDYAPAWSPDGMRIAFDSNRSGVLSIYVMDTDGTDVREVTVTGRE
jgi:TolB protein